MPMFADMDVKAVAPGNSAAMSQRGLAFPWDKAWWFWQRLKRSKSQVGRFNMVEPYQSSIGQFGVNVNHLTAKSSCWSSHLELPESFVPTPQTLLPSRFHHPSAPGCATRRRFFSFHVFAVLALPPSRVAMSPKTSRVISARL